ncbi:protein SRC2-like [Salvia miltiorrhiza]|uniref:protein SRC2-like n=1 Tax=Salvia miltiorrhiza TaxID=226208 RepID=UPI0025ABBA38|nr:protein SRC2-like [Salvia miltiorrhiza]
MEFRTMDITLRSGKNLNDVNLFRKMAVYAVVWISGGDRIPKQKTRTPTDHGGTNPTWNFPMEFKVDEAALQLNRLTLKFKLVCEQSSSRDDKVVGELSVPIKELLDSPATPDADGNKFFTYQVRKPSGRPKGELNFTCKFSEKMADASAEEMNEYVLAVELKKKIDSALELGKNAIGIGKSGASKLMKYGLARLGSGLGKKKREFGRAWHKFTDGVGQNKEEDYQPVRPNPTQTQTPDTKWATSGFSRILAKRGL